MGYHERVNPWSDYVGGKVDVEFAGKRWNDLSLLFIDGPRDQWALGLSHIGVVRVEFVKFLGGRPAPPDRKPVVIGPKLGPNCFESAWEADE